MTPYLTDTEIEDICAPLKMPAAQVRHLERLGLRVLRKPNGRPLVSRQHFEQVLAGTAGSSTGPEFEQPDEGALVLRLAGRRRHATTA